MPYKRPLWQWVIIYAVIGAVVYGVVYYLFFANKGGYSSNSYQQTTSTSSAPTASNSVQISNFSYSPATLTVKVGDSVTWTNQDNVAHSATANDGSFDTGLLDKGKSGTATFSKAGTYSYHCSLHPNMKATIIVQ